MKPAAAMAARKLGKFLTRDFRRIFGSAQDDIAERLGLLARSTIECLGRSDALYHNFEHTLLVTLVGSRYPAWAIIDGTYRACGLQSPHRRMPTARHRLCTWCVEG